MCAFAVSSEFCFESGSEFVLIPVNVCFSKSEGADIPVVHAVYRIFPVCCANSSGKAVSVLVEHAECALVGVNETSH